MKNYTRFTYVLFSVLLISFHINSDAQVSGSVFRDINNDGVRQTLNPAEPWEYGVTVRAYSSTNLLLGTATTNASGFYSFSTAQTPAALPLRLEFIVGTGDQPSKRIASNKTNVQFVVAGPAAVNVDFAIASQKTFTNTANPYIATTAATNGNALSSGTNTAGEANNLYIFPYDLSNDGGNTRRAANKYLGSVYGLTWQRESRTLLMAAYLKRHVSFGPNGIGAIYATQVSTTGVPSAPSLLLNVTLLGINVGTDPRLAALPNDPRTPNTDVGVFAEVGKRGIGGIDLTDDGRELYLVNMYEKKLHRVNIGNPIKTSFSAADVTGSWLIPNPGTAGTVWHPMAVQVNNGKIYVGGVAAKETTGFHNIADTANMRGVIYEFNPASNSFTEVLRFPFNHRRGFSNADYKYEFRNNYWSCWQNNGDISLTAPLRRDLKASITPSTTWPSALYYAQPMLCNIEFDADGSMILGIRDRFGDQGGYANLFETGNEAGETYRTISSGEVLKAGKSGSGWILENNGSVTNNGVTTTTPGRTDNNPAQAGTFSGYTAGDTPWGGSYGPGGGYFYYNHNFSLTGVPAPFNSMPANQSHYLKSNGGLAVYPGYNEVLATAMDPINRAYSSGIIKNYNSGPQAGNMSGRFELIVETAGNPSGFGKAGALGDLEILLDAQVMEIGNRVWYDANVNGRQDAGESGFAGVSVILRSPGADAAFNTGDDQTWTRVTDANGNYYFDETIVNDNRRPASWIGVSATNSGILPGFQYRIEINHLQPALGGAILTGKDWTNDEIDNDGAYGGGIVICNINPGGSTGASSIFSNNYNFDFGFFVPVLSTQKLQLSGALNGNDVNVKWETIQENNVSRYFVERSLNSTDFSAVNSVPSKGNGDYNYQYADNISTIGQPVIYYRVRAENNDGTIKYSNIISINRNKTAQLFAGPNPFSENLNIQLSLPGKAEVSIRLLNSSGQVMHRENKMLNKGLNSFTINMVQQLAKGLYILEVKSADNTFFSNQKLMKQ